MIEYIVCRAGVREPEQKVNDYGGIVFYVPKHTWEHSVCELKPGGRLTIETGIKMKIPSGLGMLITNIPSNPALYGLVVDTQLVHTNNGNEIIISMYSTNKEHSIFITEGDAIAIGVIIQTGIHTLQKGDK